MGEIFKLLLNARKLDRDNIFNISFNIDEIKEIENDINKLEKYISKNEDCNLENIYELRELREDLKQATNRALKRVQEVINEYESIHNLYAIINTAS